MLLFLGCFNFFYCLFLTIHSCLSHIISFEFSFPNFYLFLLCSLASFVTQLGEVVVLEVVHQEVIWLNNFLCYNLVLKTLYQEEKEDSKRSKFELIHFKKQFKHFYSFHQTPHNQTL